MSEENLTVFKIHLTLRTAIGIWLHIHRQPCGRSSLSSVELFQKVRWRQRNAVLFDGKVAHDMRLLLPHVHRLLVLETSLEEQNINHT